MTRKFQENKIDPEVTQKPTIDMNVVEIRGRGNKWHVFYPDEQNMVTHSPVIKDGKVVGSIGSWVATNKMIEVHEEFNSVEEAQDAAEFIHPGCTIKVIKTSTRKEAAAKAAETKRKKRQVDE
jgi:hypothetical protein